MTVGERIRKFRGEKGMTQKSYLRKPALSSRPYRGMSVVRVSRHEKPSKDWRRLLALTSSI